MYNLHDYYSINTCFYYTLCLSSWFIINLNIILQVDSSYFTVTEPGKSLLFKEWELIVDEEDEVSYCHIIILICSVQ